MPTGGVRTRQEGLSDCKAIADERDSAKPAGLKQPHGCFNQSLPLRHSFRLRHRTAVFGLRTTYADRRGSNPIRVPLPCRPIFVPELENAVFSCAKWNRY